MTRLAKRQHIATRRDKYTTRMIPPGAFELVAPDHSNNICKEGWWHMKSNQFFE